MVLLYLSFLELNEKAVYWSKTSYTSHYRVDDIAAYSWEIHHQIGYDSNILDGFAQLPQKKSIQFCTIYVTFDL